MAGKSDFTAEEWEEMQKGVAGAALLVSVSDRSFFDTFKEAGALGQHLARARQNSTSKLVRELADVRGTPFGLAASPGEIEGETLEALRSSAATLEAKAPDETDGYRGFVLDVAESVAAAAGGGETAESETIAKIRSALGASGA